MLVVSDDKQFAHAPHELNKLEYLQDDQSITEPVYLFCDAVGSELVIYITAAPINIVKLLTKIVVN